MRLVFVEQDNDLIGVGHVPVETLRELIVHSEEGQILEEKVGKQTLEGG